MHLPPQHPFFCCSSSLHFVSEKVFRFFSKARLKNMAIYTGSTSEGSSENHLKLSAIKCINPHPWHFKITSPLELAAWLKERVDFVLHLPQTKTKVKRSSLPISYSDGRREIVPWLSKDCKDFPHNITDDYFNKDFYIDRVEQGPEHELNRLTFLI